MNTDTLAPSDGQDEGLTLSASPDIDLSIGGSILEETKNRLMDRYGDQIETITLDRVVIGIFYRSYADRPPKKL